MNSGSTLRSSARKVGLASASLAAVFALSACGGGNAEAYCSTIEDAVGELDNLADSDPQEAMGEGMNSIVTMLDDSASDAPEEISDAHDSVQEGFETLNDLNMEALLDPEALMTMSEDERAELEDEAAAAEEKFEALEEDGETWGSWVEENCEVEEPLG